MIPLLDGRQERDVAKARLIEVLQAAGSGPEATLPASLLAVEMGWSAMRTGTVQQLAREINLDTHHVIGVTDHGLYYAASVRDQLEVARHLLQVAADCRRVVRRICPALNDPPGGAHGL